MSLSSFLIRIIFLALPGIISSVLYRKLRGRPVRKDWEDYVEIAIFSLASYALYGLGVFALNKARLSGGILRFFKHSLMRRPKSSGTRLSTPL